MTMASTTSPFTALTMGIDDPYQLTDDQLKAAEEKLVDLKHNVLSFYTTADEALQLYQHNDVALIFANYGQQQVKAMQDAGAHIAYVNPKEGAPAWLDTWAMTSGVQDKDLAEAWVNFVLQKKIGQQLSERTGFGNTVVPFPAPAKATSWSGSSRSRIRPSAPTCGTRSRRRHSSPQPETGRRARHARRPHYRRDRTDHPRGSWKKHRRR